MAALAALLELPFVWVTVAVRTAGKFQAPELDRRNFRSALDMTPFALHGIVLSRQGEDRPRVIE
jgi:hypothetical protein